MNLDRVGRAFGLPCIGLFLVVAFTPLANHLYRWTSALAEPGTAEAIVVLGSGVYGDGSLGNSSLRRAIDGVVLFRERFSPLLVFLGPDAAEGQPKEAEVRASLARVLGVPPEAILTESSSWTTREEATHLRKLLAPRGIRRILLVTNSLHMWRAKYVLQRAGFEVVPAPVNEFETKSDSPQDRLLLTGKIAQELLARLYYRLTDIL